MSDLKYNDITDSITQIKLQGNLNEEFNLNPFKKKVPSYDEIGDSLSRSASKARSLPNVTFEPDRTVIHDVMDKSSVFPVTNLPKVSIPGGLAAGAYSFKGKDMSLNPNFVKAHYNIEMARSHIRASQTKSHHLSDARRINPDVMP